jgi:NAD(P)-dependent dehydrogenase (short-subunit alcohol dehydrogenase family)
MKQSEVHTHQATARWRRIGQASDLDAAAVYFMSDGARFVTGQVLSVDGGWSVSEGQIPQE